jgi:uncharacterized membrane protein
MPRPFRLVARCLIIVAVVTATAVAIAPASPAGSPYLSALSDLAASPAFAAKPQHCHGTCEFASPGYVCTDGSGTKCSFTSGHCVTVIC